MSYEAYLFLIQFSDYATDVREDSRAVEEIREAMGSKTPSRLDIVERSLGATRELVESLERKAENPDGEALRTLADISKNYGWHKPSTGFILKGEASHRALTVEIPELMMKRSGRAGKLWGMLLGNGPDLNVKIWNGVYGFKRANGAGGLNSGEMKELRKELHSILFEDPLKPLADQIDDKEKEHFDIREAAEYIEMSDYFLMDEKRVILELVYNLCSIDQGNMLCLVGGFVREAGK